MVNINFLNQDKEFEEAIKFKFKLKISYVLMVGLISIIWLVYVCSVNIFLKNYLEEKQENLKIMEDKNFSLKKLIDENRKIIKTLEDIEKLDNQKILLVKSLDAINSKITDDIWLTSLERNNEGLLIIEGKAFGDISVGNFVASLKETKIFKDINLKFTKVNLVKNTKVKEFKIEMKLDF